MTLSEMKKKVLGLIEELSPNHEKYTEDPDIATKLNDVINQVAYELARHKKIPDYVEIEVQEGDLIRFDNIAAESGYEVYQIDIIRGVDYESKAQGTVIKAMEAGTMEIDYFRYPELINEKTKDNYEFELSADVLEIMPYGVAADLLKSDASNNFGEVYAARYNELKQLLDPRYSMGSIYIEGGVEI